MDRDRYNTSLDEVREALEKAQDALDHDAVGNLLLAIREWHREHHGSGWAVCSHAVCRHASRV